MLTWLLVIILAYIFFALASLCDKLVLAGRPKPIAYIFYVGVFGLITLLLIPFIKIGIPNFTGFMWIILFALVHLIGLYSMYVALKKFDVSSVISTIGATQPIFIFILTWVFWGPQVILGIDILAFVLLFIGSIVISIGKAPNVTSNYLKITLLSSLMFSFEYIFAKFVFLSQEFFPGIIWIAIFLFLFVLPLLLKESFRVEIFGKQIIFNKKNQVVFLYAQICGGIATFLQSLAIYLVPVVFLATVNSLRGIQYVFLFIITLFSSFYYPKILKEEISKKVIIQKSVSILLIAIGLAILIGY